MINFIPFVGLLSILKEKLTGWSETSVEDFIQDYYNIEQDYYKEEIEFKSTKTNARVLSAKMS